MPTQYKGAIGNTPLELGVICKFLASLHHNKAGSQRAKKGSRNDNHQDGNHILCVYKNPKWLVCIKNWKPDNDIAGIAHLEIHHSTDEQFILAAGKAILITAERENGSFKNIELTPMQQGKVYNVPAECWFYSITQKDTKVIYVQDSNCSMENSDLADLTAAQIADIQERARKILAE